MTAVLDNGLLVPEVRRDVRRGVRRPAVRVVPAPVPVATPVAAPVPTPAPTVAPKAGGAGVTHAPVRTARLVTPARDRHLAVIPHINVRREAVGRRALEWTFAATLAVVLSPLLLLLAGLVKLTSDGPVFFKHTRIGYGGRPFEVIKFRTMYQDAEQRAAELFAEMNTGSGPLQKIRHDPRITSVGRWMRRFSLDEIPQLFNVLNGSMSLIGPRPSSPAEVVKFAPIEHRRHAVRPGMTGLAQVSGRSDLRWDGTVRLDLYYVENQSMLLDLYILLRTVPAVLAARGAY